MQRVKNGIAAFRFSTLDGIDYSKLEKFGANYFLPLGNAKTFNGLDLLKDRLEIPEVGAIVTAKARAFANMKLRIVSKKTGEDVEPDQEMPNRKYYIKVLRDPNWFQSQKEFLMQTKDFRETFGEEIIYLNKPYGMDSLRAEAMFTLPPYLVETKTNDEIPFYLQLKPEISYKFRWGNKLYNIDKENIIHLTSNRVDMDSKNWVRGESWITLNKACVNNIRLAYEARGVLLENRGILGILVNRSAGDIGAKMFSEQEQEALQEKLRKFGTRKGQKQWVMTGQNLQFVKTSIDNPANLGMFEEIAADFNRLCDSAGLNAGMFSNEKGSTFENQKQYGLMMYQNTIIPETEEWIGALNSYFGTENKSWVIIASFDHLPVFQENLSERGAALGTISSALTGLVSGQIINTEEARNELRRAGIALPSKNTP